MTTSPANLVEPLRILVVEDVSADAELELRELRRAGVQFAARIVEIESDFRREIGTFDPHVILSDFSLPRFSGMDALSISRELCPDIPFIFVSGTIGEENAVAALRNGATDYVLKTNLKRFAPAVRRAVEEARERKARLAAEQLARETQQHFSLFMRHLPASAYTKDLQGRFTFVNSTFELLVGRPGAQILAMTTSDLYPPEYAENIVAHDRLALETGQPLRAIEKVKLGTTERAFLVTRFPITNDGGKVQMLGGIALDITDRLEMEKALERSEARFRGIVETTEEWIWEIDARGGMTYNNPAAERILGYSSEELTGRTVSFLVDERDHPQLEELVEKAARLKSGWNGVLLRWRHKDGSLRWLESNGKPFLAADGTLLGFRGADRDVTERVLQEEKVRRLSRMHSVLSAINAATVRVNDREDLLTEACRVLVEKGQLKLAWAGVVEPGARTILPVAMHGDGADSLRRINLGTGGQEHEADSIGVVALRRRQRVIVNDIERDGLSGFWRQYTLELGFRSAAAFPLSAGGEFVAVLVLFAGEANFFDAEEIRLLDDLVADLSFALDHMEKQAQLDYLAYYDSLTGLANRALFLDRLGQSLHETARNRTALAVMLMDLERFGAINDSLGRQGGDALLKLVAERLRSLHGSDHVARIGMNSFAVLIGGIAGEMHAGRVAEQSAKNIFTNPFRIDANDLRLAAKFGITMFPADGKDAETLLRNAETALKQAKDSGDGFVYYEPRLNAGVTERLGLENRLRRAMEDNQFVLHYQPKVNLASGKLEGLEALIRWNDPENGLTAPFKFIPILEETGMILDVGRWALREAATAFSRWREQGFAAPRIAVNVAASQLRQKNFAAEVASIVASRKARHGVDIEITESMIMEEIDRSIVIIRSLREAGIMVAMDDFGTGYSSLSYLARLPIDYLKIDRSFIAKIDEDSNDLTIVTAIISMAHSLHLKIVAEGVEKAAQRDLLSGLQCDQIQGYLVSRPVPENQIVALFSREKS
ncbi:MAG TPA: EAL domain-containing protein [Burkholderiales bacterium]|nr:EAL domain-containing protein [Burkholderiales bacterium]